MVLKHFDLTRESGHCDVINALVNNKVDATAQDIITALSQVLLDLYKIESDGDAENE